jgi:Arc/MetJ-type ribon-helix-helix transcriptional regulator
MMRVRFQLPPDDLERVKLEAARCGVSVSELIRRSLRELLERHHSKPWLRYAGMVGGLPGPRPSIDEVVYGRRP